MSYPLFFDRVMETSSTTGTGAYALGGAVTGFQSFGCVGDGQSCYYCAQSVDGVGNPNGGWEVGIGTYTLSGTTLSRDTILGSSNSNAAVSWSSGTRRIFLTVPAQTLAPANAPIIGVPLLGAKYVQVFQSNLAIGTTDLYTVPTGKRAIITHGRTYNPSGGSITWVLKHKISGTYYRMMNTQTTTTLNSAATSAGIGHGCTFIAEAGESLAITTTTTAGLNIWCLVTEFDAASPLKCARIIGLSTGDNTVYTCPAGKVAVAAGCDNSTGAHKGMVQCPGLSAGFFIADGGATRNTVTFHVRNGETTANPSYYADDEAAAADTRFVTFAAFALGPGDSYVINVDVGNAAQMVQWPYVEF